MKYSKFFKMIAVSTAVMFGLMYLNTYAFDHVFFSETRFYMAFVMGAAMSVIMLSFMIDMYHDKKMNLVIYGASLLVFIGALFLVRSQITVDDTSYMKAMIPHHSIAIMTSERANIADLRVRQLADGIADTQRQEIKEMEWLIDDIKKNDVAATAQEAVQRPVPEF